MSEIKNILFVGVGGQGTILASKILTEGLMQNGMDVKMSEVHGMAQRGGSVTTQVRYGEKVYSPFGGIGSEGYQSIIDGRYAILGELKPEYFGQMIENLEKAEFELKQKNNDLFSTVMAVNE